MIESAIYNMIDAWANDASSCVALHLKQKLLPVEGKDGIIFPPTYADIGYNVDLLSNGQKVAAIDSVGSQANRMEAIFKQDPYSKLVPQVRIKISDERFISLLDVGHRLGDALVRASDLADEAEAAFSAYQDQNDASAIAKIAPTSLVFGVWDSRGKGAKIPRLVGATVRAWDVDVLHRAATYIPSTDFSADSLLGSHGEDAAEKDARSGLGFQHAPATWTTNEKIPQYRDGKPNNERRILGGVLARGDIFREVTINLIALRRLDASSGQALRRYILALALIAANDLGEEFLRQGCLLTLDPNVEPVWEQVERSGKRLPIALPSSELLIFAEKAAKEFGILQPPPYAFSKQRARQLIDEQKKSKKKKGKKEKASSDGAEESGE